MPFWKKSEDPWDARPERPKAAPSGEEEAPLTILRELKERVKSAMKPPQVPEPAAETCPWCKQPMEQGYLHGGGWIYWQKERPKAASLTGHAADALVVNDEGGLVSSYKTVWHCPACQKLVMDAPVSPPAPGSFLEDGLTEKTEE
ncbi:PF20097 family protein [Oscillibacter sp.]|uniref:PF20097 family protein n=1 Tax=Oscillibacter sp. TaxID=1945593 RepID=UPI00261D4AD0|nr:PF20097 family protein [Oscillibacter sp.]MDD3346375.1 PF20097 family protein [Oscillibacter sp.]